MEGTRSSTVVVDGRPTGPRRVVRKGRGRDRLLFGAGNRRYRILKEDSDKKKGETPRDVSKEGGGESGLSSSPGAGDVVSGLWATSKV